MNQPLLNSPTSSSSSEETLRTRIPPLYACLPPTNTALRRPLHSPKSFAFALPTRNVNPHALSAESSLALPSIAFSHPTQSARPTRPSPQNAHPLRRIYPAPCQPTPRRAIPAVFSTSLAYVSLGRPGSPTAHRPLTSYGIRSQAAACFPAPLDSYRYPIQPVCPTLFIFLQKIPDRSSAYMRRLPLRICRAVPSPTYMRLYHMPRPHHVVSAVLA